MYRCCCDCDCECECGAVPGLSGEGAGLRLKGLVEWVRGEWRVVSAVVVAPAPGLEEVEVVMVRGAEAVAGYEVVGWCVEEEGFETEEGFACVLVRAEWARKAARKLERKGRLVGILMDSRACMYGLWSGR